MSIVDTAKPVREGESLDIERLSQYLKNEIPDLEGQATITQFPGGASNLTYLIQFQNIELVLRRPPFGHKAKSAHDMLREARVIQSLKPHYPAAPSVLNVCSDQSVIGCDFFIMERLKGFIPRKDLPSDMHLSSDATRKFCLAGLDKLIELHSIDIENSGLQELGKGEGYVQRQIHGWSERWEKAITADAPNFETTINWLKENQPNDIKNCVIHNDFRFDNLVFNPENLNEVIGVLDWEMATIGDPLMDLGNSLAYWIEESDHERYHIARLQPTHLPGMLTREEVINYYLEKTKIKIDSFLFYEIYGIFRLAVIAQQIYYRYFHQQTKDKRFGGFGHFVQLLEHRCRALLDTKA